VAARRAAGRRTARARTAARRTARAPVTARGAGAIPTTMKAAALDRFGPPSVFAVKEVPVPEPGPRDVLIAVHAVGVGYWDARARDGSWAEKKTRFPLVLGTDGSGEVVARGARVRRLDVGERVWASQYQNPKGGFYAEYVAVEADNAAPVPPGLELLEAGAAAATGLTALQGIDDVLGVRRGETVLVFGASGAVGTLAVQFARRRGARVLGTASGRDAAALVRELGAEEVIDARRDDAVERLRALAPDGLDAVLALAGGEPLERCLDLVRAGGRVAFPNGVEPEPRRRRGIRTRAFDGVAGPRGLAKLGSAVEEAGLRVPIAAVFPLAQAAKAHARLEEGHVLGRIVLQVRGA